MSSPRGSGSVRLRIRNGGDNDESNGGASNLNSNFTNPSINTNAINRSADYISPFSSSNSDFFISASNNSEEVSGNHFKSKFDEEKERNRKLTEKLSGYKTIVSQFSKEHQENQVLKQKIADLERELTEKSLLIASQTTVTPTDCHNTGADQMQGCGEVLSELSHPPQSGLTSKPTSNNSPSFVVLQHYGRDQSLLGSSQDHGQQVPNTSLSHGDHTAMEGPNGPEGFTIINPQTKTNNDLVQPEKSDLISNEFEKVSLNVTEYVSQSPVSTYQTGQPNSPQNSSSTTEGMVTITAWAGQTVKPAWQMEQEALLNKAKEDRETTQLKSRGKPWTSQCDNQSHFETKTSSSQLPERNINIPFANDTQEDKQLQKEVQSALKPLQPSTENSVVGTCPPVAPIQTWGVGARPKASNNLGDVQPLVNSTNPFISSQNNADVSHFDQLNAPPLQGNTNSNVAQNVFALEKPGDSNPAKTEKLASSSEGNHSKSGIPDQSTNNNGVQFDNQNFGGDTFEQWVNINPEDLMKFPSLKSSQFVQEKLVSESTDITETSDEKKPLERIGSNPSREPMCFSEKQVVAVPSDEQPQLASQAHSIAAVMSNHAGISDMLYQFAKTASQMEEKLIKCQTLIQRQQVQIQSQHSYEHEVQVLRKENKGLLAYIKEMRAQQSQTKVVEHDWTFLERPQKSSTFGHLGSETGHKLRNLEDINGRLFQANKEWFTKWESLRLQTQARQQEVESQLKGHKGDVARLQKEVAALEEQLKGAVTARQEEKKRNLDLEQEKLNMKKKMEMRKTQVENLCREKRQLQSDIAVIKADISSKNMTGQVGGKTFEDLTTEMFLLKQQAKLFHEDFQREREDRTKLQEKMEKLRNERELLKMDQISKSKKYTAMLKMKEEDLRTKSKQIVDLQCQLDDLKLQNEKKKSHQHVHRSSSVPGAQHKAAGSTTKGGSAAGLSRTVPFTNPGDFPQRQQSLSPEHLPGAWQCQACTFINFPERIVCDICGASNTPGNRLVSLSSEASGRGTPVYQALESRGQTRITVVDDVPDTVPDTDPDNEETQLMELRIK